MYTGIVKAQDTDLGRWVSENFQVIGWRNAIASAHCRLHLDRRGSARMDVGRSRWYCESCGGSGSLRLLAKKLGILEAPPESEDGGAE